MMIWPLFKVLIAQQVTKARIFIVAAMAIGLALIAFAINANTTVDVNESIIGFLSVVGLGLVTPILCLIFASSSLGQLVEDNTLVYLWLRPYARWQLATAAFLASAAVAVPAVLVPNTLAAAVGSSGDPGTTAAVAASTALAAVGYCALFVFFGMLLRRSLEFGLVYIFIWELFVARAGAGAARLSLNTYPASLLAYMGDLDLPQADRSTSAAIVVPLLIVPVALWLTTWRLNNTEVA